MLATQATAAPKLYGKKLNMNILLCHLLAAIH